MFRWDKLSEATGVSSVVISMNAFLLITVLAFYKILQPEDPAAVAQFRSQIRLVYLISFLLGNTIILFLYKRDVKAIQEEKELKRQLAEERKIKKEEKLKKERELRQKR